MEKKNPFFTPTDTAHAANAAMMIKETSGQ
jgi:hypothetical protein